MSWQPGDVSPDARRTAEAAADAAGVPLKEWLAETVRAAIMRELGRIPVEEPTPEHASGKQEPLELKPPIAEPVVALSTKRPDQEPPEEAPVAPFAAEAPHPPAEPQPPIPEPVAAAEPPAPAEVAELEPFIPAPIAASPAAPPIIEPAAPGAAKDAPALAARRQAAPDTRGIADSGFSSWLATRIEGLPTRAAPLGDLPPIAPPTASPPAPPRLRLDPVRPAPVPTSPAARAPPLQAAQTAEPALPLALPAGPVTTLRLTSLRPARIRARRPGDVDPAIPALAASVGSQGVREPILVRRLAEKADQYEVVAGERRRLAAERAGRADLPAVIVEADDSETLLLSLTENLGRGDFSPLDEARAYLRLLTEYRVSPGALAQRLARERSHIALALRLLGLPPSVRQLIDSGRLAPGQAFALLGAPDPEAMADQMIWAATGGDGARDSA